VQIRGKNVPVVMSLLLWLSLWEIIGRSGLIFVIPPFSDVVRAMFDLVRGSTFWKDVALSLKAFGAGLGISLSLGIPLGFLMGVSRRADEMMGMWVNIFISAPITALVPIIMAVFGIGESTIVVTIVLFTIWVIILDTQTGIKGIKQSLLEMAHSFGASRPQLYAKVIFWSALPEILTGLRMAIIRGVRGMIVGQMLIAILGLGKLFLFYSQYFLMARFFSLLIFVLLFAWGLAELVGYFEQKVEHFAKGR
jgi:NitT/TauT family transport system permease protein